MRSFSTADDDHPVSNPSVEKARSRRSLARLVRDTAIVVGMSVGLLLGLELFCRLFAPQLLRGESLHGRHFSEPDPLLGMRYVPGAVWRFRTPEYQVEYAINTEGFRDATVRQVRKPPGVLRVLLLGDSFTFGHGVAYDRTWPVLAESRLAHQGLRVDLVKAGIQGADTRSELVLLRRLAQRYDVDAVVVGFLINDLYSNLPYTQKPESNAPAPELTAFERWKVSLIGSVRRFHLLTLAQRIVTASDAGYIALYLTAPDRGNYVRVPLSAGPRRQVAVTDTLLMQMAAFCDSLSKPLIVFSMPQQFQVMFARHGRTDAGIDVRYYDRHFTQLAESRGFDWVPALDALVTAERSSGQDMFYRLDGHFTPGGAAVAAEVFLDKVMPRILAAATRLRRSSTAPGHRR